MNEPQHQQGAKMEYDDDGSEESEESEEEGGRGEGEQEVKYEGPAGSLGSLEVRWRVEEEGNDMYFFLLTEVLALGRASVYCFTEHHRDGARVLDYTTLQPLPERVLKIQLLLPTQKEVRISKDIKRQHTAARHTVRVEDRVLGPLRLSSSTAKEVMIDPFEEDGRAWYGTVMEKGTDAPIALSRIPEDRKALALFTFSQDLLLAVSAYHAVNLVHRDLKGANIILRDDGRYVLGDIGDAAFLRSNPLRMGTVAGAAGTPEFVSPGAFSLVALAYVKELEKIMPEGAMDVTRNRLILKSPLGYQPRDDVFSCGVAVYEAYCKLYLPPDRTVRSDLKLPFSNIESFLVAAEKARSCGHLSEEKRRDIAEKLGQAVTIILHQYKTFLEQLPFLQEIEDEDDKVIKNVIDTLFKLGGGPVNKPDLSKVLAKVKRKVTQYSAPLPTNHSASADGRALPPIANGTFMSQAMNAPPPHPASSKKTGVDTSSASRVDASGLRENINMGDMNRKDHGEVAAPASANPSTVKSGAGSAGEENEAHAMTPGRANSGEASMSGGKLEMASAPMKLNANRANPFADSSGGAKEVGGGKGVEGVPEIQSRISGASNAMTFAPKPTPTGPRAMSASVNRIDVGSKTSHSGAATMALANPGGNTARLIENRSSPSDLAFYHGSNGLRLPGHLMGRDGGLVGTGSITPNQASSNKPTPSGARTPASGKVQAPARPYNALSLSPYTRHLTPSLPNARASTSQPSTSFAEVRDGSADKPKMVWRVAKKYEQVVIIAPQNTGMRKMKDEKIWMGCGQCGWKIRGSYVAFRIHFGQPNPANLDIPLCTGTISQYGKLKCYWDDESAFVDGALQRIRSDVLTPM